MKMAAQFKEVQTTITHNNEETKKLWFNSKIEIQATINFNQKK